MGRNLSQAVIAGFDLTGLTAHWKLNEASGNRADSSGAGNTLTDINTVTQNTGKINEAAEFTAANNEGLRGSSVIGALTADRTFVGWVYLTDKLAVYTLFSKWNTVAGTEFNCRYNSVTDRFEWVKGDDASSLLEAVKADTFGSPTAATWYFICCTYTNSDKKFRISVNNGAFDVGANTGNPAVENGLFYLGRLDDVASLPLNGRIDSFSVFNRILSSAEITALYNSGNGIDYPFS